MSDKRHIDAVFDNEDDAQTALIQAKLLGATQCQVERFFNDDEEPTISPAIGTSNVNSGTNSAGISPLFNFASTGFIHGSQSDNTPKALLSCEIDTHKESQCRNLIAEHGGRLF